MHPKYPKVHEFFINLAINHSVVTETDSDGKIKYSASSPDEGAFVEAARHLGIEFMSRTSDGAEINDNGEIIQLKLLSSMDFTSERKRSSVLCELKNVDGTVRRVLYCKGADSMICSLLKDKSQFDDLSAMVIDEYAKEGLRTLCLAKKELTPEEFEKWSEEFKEANLANMNRQDLLDRCADNLEVNLEYMGITGVEDRLQDDVPDTLKILRGAGIKVWMLTGDKTETAINIGISTGIIHPTSFLLQLTSETEMDVEDLNSQIKLEREKIEHENYIGEEKKRCLIVNGTVLWQLLERKFLDDFLFLCENCQSVIACRITPFQKGAIVTAVRRMLHKITLAIGDGANDCNMIQKADIGIGIKGKEGLQAYNTSDYGISQFRHLKFLILVHGNWSYKRISKMVLYMFYKNVVLVFPLVFFGFFSLFSGQKIYAELLYQFFNVFYTSFAISVMGIFDCELDRHMVLKYPQLYKLNQINFSFSIPLFLKWMFFGAFHGFIVLFVPVYTLGFYNIPLNTGEVYDMWIVGVAVFTLILVVVNLKVILETDKYFWLFPITLGLGFMSFILTVLILAFWPGLGGLFLGVTQKLFLSWTFYLVVLVTVGLAISFDWFFKCLEISLYPSAITYVQLKEFNNYNIFKGKFLLGNYSFIERPTIVTPSPSGNLPPDVSFQEDKSFTGFAFSPPDKETYAYVQNETSKA